MYPVSRRAVLASSIAAAAGCTGKKPPAPPVVDDGFRPLFNGRDLSGWHPVNVHPNTFSVRDGMIISSGKPTGVMRTDRHYENFIIELDYKHIVPQGNAGLFVWSDALTALGQPFTRSIEIQVLDGRNTDNYTSHGDIFSIHGATMTPDRPHPAGWARSLPIERRAYPAGEWNSYRLTANNGVLKLEVNGKEVSGGHSCSPRKGYICLEAEGSECHFRFIRIKELPSTNAPPEHTASIDQGFKSVYNGIDLAGFQTTPTHAAAWIPKDWTLSATGRGPSDLPTAAQYKELDFILDYRPQADRPAGVSFRGLTIPLNNVAKGKWHRLAASLRNNSIATKLITENQTINSTPRANYEHPQGPLTLQHANTPHDFANLYIRSVNS